MANFTGVFEMVDSISFIAGEDLTGDDHRLVKLDAEGKVIKSVAAGDLSIGVVGMHHNANEGSSESSDEQIVQVAMLTKGGIMVGEAGGVIALGDLLHSDATGRIISAGANIAALTAGDFVVGQCVEAAAAAGEKVSFVAMSFLSAA